MVNPQANLFYRRDAEAAKKAGKERIMNFSIGLVNRITVLFVILEERSDEGSRYKKTQN
jgi:hypothetical protein